MSVSIDKSCSRFDTRHIVAVTPRVIILVGQPLTIPVPQHSLVPVSCGQIIAVPCDVDIVAILPKVVVPVGDPAVIAVPSGPVAVRGGDQIVFIPCPCKSVVTVFPGVIVPVCNSAIIAVSQDSMVAMSCDQIVAIPVESLVAAESREPVRTGGLALAVHLMAFSGPLEPCISMLGEAPVAVDVCGCTKMMIKVMSGRAGGRSHAVRRVRERAAHSMMIFGALPVKGKMPVTLLRTGYRPCKVPVMRLLQSNISVMFRAVFFNGL